MAQTQVKSRYIGIFLRLIGILALAGFQLGFISGLPWGLSRLNLVLVVLIFILTLTDLEITFYWLFGLGFLLDLFGFLPFGANLISLGLTIIVANVLLVSFFTNRSQYSFLALTFLSSIAYLVFLSIANYSLGALSGETAGVLIIDRVEYYLTVLGYNLLAMLIIFQGLNSLSDSLKPVFLSKKY